MRILVVEDNHDSAALLTLLLKKKGYEVRTVHDGRSGLAEAGAFQPDAIISDIGLPDLNGYEFARQLRLIDAFKDTPLIAISGYGQPSDVEKAIDSGFDHHLLKPYGIEELVALLTAQSRTG